MGTGRLGAFVRYQLWKENGEPAWDFIKNGDWVPTLGPSRKIFHTIEANPNDDVKWGSGITLFGNIWGKMLLKHHRPIKIPEDAPGYRIDFTGQDHIGTSSNEGSHYWESSFVLIKIIHLTSVPHQVLQMELLLSKQTLLKCYNPNRTMKLYISILEKEEIPELNLPYN